MKPLHRDDLPFDIMEGLAEEIDKLYPGMKIRCAGDMATLPPDVADMMAKLEDAHKRSLREGLCIDCGAKMPGYPTSAEELSAGWAPADGWNWFSEVGSDDIQCWQCPACDANEEDGEKPLTLNGDTS